MKKPKANWRSSSITYESPRVNLLDVVKMCVSSCAEQPCGPDVKVPFSNGLRSWWKGAMPPLPCSIASNTIYESLMADLMVGARWRGALPPPRPPRPWPVWRLHRRYRTRRRPGQFRICMDRNASGQCQRVFPVNRGRFAQVAASLRTNPSAAAENGSCRDR